jgi:hypothetical protein
LLMAFLFPLHFQGGKDNESRQSHNNLLDYYILHCSYVKDSQQLPTPNAKEKKKKKSLGARLYVK